MGNQETRIDGCFRWHVPLTIFCIYTMAWSSRILSGWKFSSGPCCCGADRVTFEQIYKKDDGLKRAETTALLLKEYEGRCFRTN